MCCEECAASYMPLAVQKKLNCRSAAQSISAQQLTQQTSPQALAWHSTFCRAPICQGRSVRLEIWCAMHVTEKSCREWESGALEPPSMLQSAARHLVTFERHKREKISSDGKPKSGKTCEQADHAATQEKAPSTVAPPSAYRRKPPQCTRKQRRRGKYGKKLAQAARPPSYKNRVRTTTARARATRTA